MNGYAAVEPCLTPDCAAVQSAKELSTIIEEERAARVTERKAREAKQKGGDNARWVEWAATQAERAARAAERKAREAKQKDEEASLKAHEAFKKFDKANRRARKLN